jgi:hypothetical protein
MGALSKSLLLFVLNWVDAQLTLIWVRLNVASEGNALMAQLLGQGEGSFLLIKLAVGGGAAYILYRCAHIPLAKRGLTFVLVLYVALMFVHAATGCVALGLHIPIL